MLSQPRDANGCFSRRQPARRMSVAGTEDSCSLVKLYLLSEQSWMMCKRAMQQDCE